MLNSMSSLSWDKDCNDEINKIAYNLLKNETKRVPLTLNGKKRGKQSIQAGSTSSIDEDDDKTVLIEFRIPNCRTDVLERLAEFVKPDLSEPYSPFTFRYFLETFPKICVFAYDVTDYTTPPHNDYEPIVQDLATDGTLVGAVISKLSYEEEGKESGHSMQHLAPFDGISGYIGMVVVAPEYRRRSLGTLLVRLSMELMAYQGATSVMLETEVCNAAALALYERLGFIRVDRITRYYLSGNDAFVLKRPLPRKI